MKILLLEDEYLLSRSIRTYLLRQGYFVDDFDNGKEVLERIEEKAYDFYILDINTPLVGGLECLEVINARHPETPKIIISAYHDIDHITKAYDLGCSDYLKKPFNLKELEIKITKLASMVQEQQEVEDPIMKLSARYAYHKERKQLLYNGGAEMLTPRESALMELFIANMGQIVNETMIQQHVWKDEAVQHATVRSLVNRLRAKLKDELVDNVRGFGYIIRPPESHSRD